MKSKQKISPGGLLLKDQLISINRVTKVVKGGKNMSFAALVVVGDESGHVGFGTGKAKEVPNAIKKAIEAAKNNLIRVPLIDGTLPHEMIGEYGAGRVLLKPAAEGTGVIAGGAVRAILQSLGVHNVRTKILGSNNPHNVIRATFNGLLRMKDPIEVAEGKFAIKFSTIAIFFILIDIELLFIWPWAMLYRSLGWFGFAEMMVFLGILMLGFLYIWGKGGLEWE